jgi:hypothetical protein
MNLVPNSEKYCTKKKQPNLFDFEASMEAKPFSHLGQSNLSFLMNAEVNFYYCNALEVNEPKRDGALSRAASSH